MFRTVTICTAMMAAPTLACADWNSLATGKSVPETMEALVAAVEGAGATVFARVDHAAGAASVGMQMAPAEALIFGNPQVGTPVMVDDIRAAAVLPLQIAVVTMPDGTTQMVWQDAADILAGLGLPADAAYVGQIDMALGNLTAKAAQ